MRITSRQLRQIIREELIREAGFGDVKLADKDKDVETQATRLGLGDALRMRETRAAEIGNSLIAAAKSQTRGPQVSDNPLGDRNFYTIGRMIPGTDETRFVRIIESIDDFYILVAVDNFFRRFSDYNKGGLLKFINDKIDPLLGDAEDMDKIAAHLNSLSTYNSVPYSFEVDMGTLDLVGPGGDRHEELITDREKLFNIQ